MAMTLHKNPLENTWGKKINTNWVHDSVALSSSSILAYSKSVANWAVLTAATPYEVDLAVPDEEGRTIRSISNDDIVSGKLQLEFIISQVEAASKHNTGESGNIDGTNIVRSGTNMSFGGDAIGSSLHVYYSLSTAAVIATSSVSGVQVTTHKVRFDGSTFIQSGNGVTVPQIWLNVYVNG